MNGRLWVRKVYPKVPITRVVMWLFPVPRSLAIPKSDTLASKSSSINMLLDLMSRCTTFGSIPSCKYARLPEKKTKCGKNNDLTNATNTCYIQLAQRENISLINMVGEVPKTGPKTKLLAIFKGDTFFFYPS